MSTLAFQAHPGLNPNQQVGLCSQSIGGTGCKEVIEGILSLPETTLGQVFLENIGSGNEDLYTVPTGMRAIALFAAFNSAGTTTTYFAQVKIAGTYYRIGSSATPATLINGAVNFGYIYEQGETISINTSQAGLNAMLGIILFPNYHSLKTIKLTSLVAGNNVLYTAPVGKTPTMFGFNTFANSSGSAGFTYINSSGGTLTYKAYYVPVADVNPSTANQMVQASVANGTTIGGSFNALAMQPGDTIQLTTGSAAAGQFAFVTVFER
jgi:uncharacterized cupredoxin-like copper-binding protein